MRDIGFHLKSFNVVYFHILKSYNGVIVLLYLIGEKLYEIKILEETHKQEISRLQKRLQWYAENQELLDKDAVRLKEANEEIEKLKLEVMIISECISIDELYYLQHSFIALCHQISILEILFIKMASLTLVCVYLCSLF